MLKHKLMWGLTAGVLVTLAVLIMLFQRHTEALPFELTWQPEDADWAVIVKAPEGHFFQPETLLALRQLERQLQSLKGSAEPLKVEAITNHGFTLDASDTLLQLIPEPVPVGVGMLSAIADVANTQPRVMQRLLSADWTHASLLVTGLSQEAFNAGHRSRLIALLAEEPWAEQWLCWQPLQCEPINHN